METKTKTTTRSNFLINGNWQLTYKITNSMGIDAFGGKGIVAFNGPTGEKMFRPKFGGGAFKMYYLGTPSMLFRTSDNRQHQLDVEWLIHHPEVEVSEKLFKQLKPYYQRVKETNPKLKLSSLDQEALREIDVEDYADKMVSILIKDFGQGSLGIQKLRWILAKLDLAYVNNKFKNYEGLTEAEKTSMEKKSLRKKIKTFIKGSMENAQTFDFIIKNLHEAEDVYNVKEMIRLKILEEYPGMYKYKGINIGSNMEIILQKWSENPDLKVEMLGTLTNKKK